MAKFKIKDRVRIIGKQEVLPVEEIREILGGETKYWIQLGTNFATREWAKASELEMACKPQSSRLPCRFPSESHYLDFTKLCRQGAAASIRPTLAAARRNLASKPARPEIVFEEVQPPKLADGGTGCSRISGWQSGRPHS